MVPWGAEHFCSTIEPAVCGSLPGTTESRVPAPRLRSQATFNKALPWVAAILRRFYGKQSVATDLIRFAIRFEVILAVATDEPPLPLPVTIPFCYHACQH